MLLHAWSLRFRLRHDSTFGFEDLLDRAATDGFAGVGINFNGPQGQFLDISDRTAVRDAAVATQTRGLVCDLETTGTDPHHLSEQIELAVALGAHHLHTYATHDGPRGAVIAATIRDLIAIGPIAAMHRVPVLIENHEELTGIEIAEILSAVDHPHVGALFDYGNSMMVREDPLDALDAMRPWIRGAHLKDHAVIADAVCGVPMGDGVLPIREITSRLAASGMHRIAFENVWGYSSGFHPRKDGRPEETNASPVFAPRPPADDPVTFTIDVDGLFERDPAGVVSLEEAAYRRAKAFVDASLTFPDV